MNARVDPTSLFAPREGDNDAALIALCRATLRALDRDLALDAAYNELDDRYEALKPSYPALPWMYGFTPGSAPQLSSTRLREIAREPDRADFFRSKIGHQIKAVAAWERECLALRKSLGLDKVSRQYQRAMTESQSFMSRLTVIEAQTVQGAGYKSLVVASWMRAGYEIEDLGEELVLSILADVRRLGGSEGEGRASRRRRAVR